MLSGGGRGGADSSPPHASGNASTGWLLSMRDSRCCTWVACDGLDSRRGIVLMQLLMETVASKPAGGGGGADGGWLVVCMCVRVLGPGRKGRGLCLGH